ncbi:MAG: ABC transporter ATP-binding protein [Thermoproteota archaeon]|mgnify:CR=1 FL=1|nr:MAG: ABC transporter ATP-binding protein [Candidatus Korarchaeota archaeon]RLG53194.1 MAG: ABC transporter ATP-binding protein [Candidatus Korarchaeota archaeon]
MPEPIVDIQNVTFKYAGSSAPAIVDVSLQIKRGEVVLVTGASGSGKSTFCRLLNGLIPHFYEGEFSGCVFINGVDTRTIPVYVLSKDVGLVFQNPDNQLVSLSVEREIAFGLENLGLPREEIIKRTEFILKYFGLDRLRDVPPYKLSGGEKQRTALAAVVAMRPLLLVLDEPTAELDPMSALQLALMLSQLREMETTIVIVEHRLDVFTPLATRILVFSEGQLVRDGPPEEVLFDSNLSSLGVSTPRVVQLQLKLEELGIKLPIKALTVSSLVDQLSSAVSSLDLR